MKITGNEPAMPVTENNGLGGLTIRQQFAAMAMQGMLANTNGFHTDSGKTTDDITQKARFSVLMADALIAELNK